MCKANEAGIITCHCPAGRHLELTCSLPHNWVSCLIKQVEEIAEANKLLELPGMIMDQCPCFKPTGHIDMDNNKLLKAACREYLEDNYLYYPTVKDFQDLKHFQHHWVKGEPVVVRNMLEATAGSLWDPMVMYRACRQIRTKHMKHLILLSVWTHVRVR